MENKYKAGDVLKVEMTSPRSWTVIEQGGKLRLSPNTSKRFTDTEVVDFEEGVAYVKLADIRGMDFSAGSSIAIGYNALIATTTGCASTALGREAMFPELNSQAKEFVNGLKYFTPSIEDIRVGYEFEQNSDKRPGYPEWLPNCKIETGDDVEYVRTGEWKIRVLYLTKEQIEAEGWQMQDSLTRYIWRGSKKVIYKSEIRGDHFDYTIPTELGLIYNYDSRVLEITYDCGEFIDCRHFDGECKDINTFRYICKLLGIS